MSARHASPCVAPPTAVLCRAWGVARAESSEAGPPLRDATGVLSVSSHVLHAPCREGAVDERIERSIAAHIILIEASDGEASLGFTHFSGGDALGGVQLLLELFEQIKG